MLRIIFLLLGLSGIGVFAQNSVNVEINLNETAIEFPHYWKSTGFTPASAVQLPSMQLSLDLLSTQAGQGVRYVRPHYLLNLVGTKGLGTNNPEYNWTKLDFVLDYFVDNNFIPFFEIMGHPSTVWEAQDEEFDQYFQGQNSDQNRYFNNFEDDGQIRAWKELVKAMALHYIDRYGHEEVRTWYFETWNEPNLKHFWTFGLKGLLNYYDACSEGLKEADSLLVFGGPGTAGAPNNDTFKELLNHCDSGTNYFTGEKGVRIDFISYHIKARVRYMINNELEVIEYIRENNPGLKDLPLINNEADPIAGWGRKFFWRPDAWYASFIVQSIDHHNIYLIDDKEVNYGMLSNDNGFMGDWYRRTHFARFTKDNDDQLSRSDQFYLIKKPAVTVMSLLELLGDERFRVNLDNREKHYGLIPTRNSQGDIILALYNSPLIEITYNRPVSIEKEYVDKLIYNNSDVRFKIKLNGIIPGKYILVHYSLDEEHSNPFAEWLKAGSPEFPGTKEYYQMASKQEPQIVGIPTELNLNSPHAEIEIDMSPASVSFVLLVKKTETNPVSPHNLRYKQYKGLNGEKMVLIKWQDDLNPNILSYDVHYRSSENEDFVKINPTYLRDKSYIHLLSPESSGGEYKLKGIDYWGRESEFSDVLQID